MPAVILPPRAGVLSAVGLVCSPRQREVVRSWTTPADHAGLDDALGVLAREAAELVGAAPDAADVIVETFVDCRYSGQSHELTVGRPDAFHDEHERRNGYARSGAAVEVVALRARAHRPAPFEPGDLPAPERRAVTGPAVLTEPDCTVWVPEGWTGEVGPIGAWVLRPDRSGGGW